MRHMIPDGLKRQLSPPAIRTSKPDDRLLDVELFLSCITPVIGGGVQTREPDKDEPVRVPGVRGQLRFFFRALSDASDADALFADEARIFGGVGIPQESGNDALRSRVRISVEVMDPGKIVQAGRHPLSGDRFRPMPEWQIGQGQELGYALFPLQCKGEELKDPKWRGRSEVPTRSVRAGLRFKLHLLLLRGPQGLQIKGDEERLLRAVWAWIHLGGIGARNSRGFGAMAPIDVRLHRGEVSWRDWFALPAEGAIANWMERTGIVLGQDGPRPDRPLLRQARLFVGPSDSSADRVHGSLVGSLREFRQGLGVGRERKPRAPKNAAQGQSLWPEPAVLRRLRSRRPGDWDHPPPDEVQRANEDQLRLPRASLGLPIVVKFHSKNQRDQMANATISHPVRGSEDEEGRYASPVRLRPLSCADGRYVPLVLVFADRPKAVQITYLRDRPMELPKPLDAPDPAGTPGAREPIRGLLQKADGDAVRAFRAWLERTRGFRPVGGGRA